MTDTKQSTSRHVFQDYTGFSLWVCFILPSSVSASSPIFSAYLRCTIKNRKKNHRHNWKKKGREKGGGEGESQAGGGECTYLELIWGPIRSVLIGLSVTFRMEVFSGAVQLCFGRLHLHGLGLQGLTGPLITWALPTTFLLFCVFVLWGESTYTLLTGVAPNLLAHILIIVPHSVEKLWENTWLNGYTCISYSYYTLLCHFGQHTSIYKQGARDSEVSGNCVILSF